MVNVVFTSHAIQQLKERKISKVFVLVSIKRADVVRRQSDGRFQYIKLFKEKQKTFLLVVIVEKSLRELSVVTVFKTSKIKKYI